MDKRDKLNLRNLQVYHIAGSCRPMSMFEDKDLQSAIFFYGRKCYEAAQQGAPMVDVKDAFGGK